MKCFVVVGIDNDIFNIIIVREIFFFVYKFFNFFVDFRISCIFKNLKVKLREEKIIYKIFFFYIILNFNICFLVNSKLSDFIV